MWGIVPAAGRGSRIQPLGFSKELLPLGTRSRGHSERPCAVSEYLVERMVIAGADKLCFVIAPGKSDILEYFGQYGHANTAYVVQPRANGLCDAIFRAEPLLGRSEPVLVGLPDTVWFPKNGLCLLPDEVLSFLLFPVEQPQLFDAVVLQSDNRVREIQVKQVNAASNWIWGAFKMPAATFRDLAELWRQRNQSDEYIGTLINAYLANGGIAYGIKAGEAYVDVGTLNGYRGALQLLERMHEAEQASEAQPAAEPASAAAVAAKHWVNS
jgi:glucose-1-phosphate thymidylyltransferase